jgi:hypothetical protein
MYVKRKVGRINGKRNMEMEKIIMLMMKEGILM